MASGCVSILINNDIPQSHITFNTRLQAIAVKATSHTTINICSLYMPPHDSVNEKELKNILQQLPPPYILLKVFNSHNTILRCKATTPKDITLENVISNDNLSLFNTETQVHLKPFTATYSAIDLTLCDPSIFLDFSWRVYEDTRRCEHFPIMVECVHPHEEDFPLWKLNKSNWEEFRSLFFKYFIHSDITYSVNHFTEKTDHDS